MNDWKLFWQDHRDSLSKILVFFGWIIFLGFTFYELNFIRVLVLCLDCLEILVLRDDMFLGFAYNLRPKVDILGEREQSSTMWQSRL